MTWNHRVLRHVKESDDVWYGIHEVFYNDKGEPDSCTEHLMKPMGASPEELKQELELMVKSIEKPILDYEYFERLEVNDEP